MNTEYNKKFDSKYYLQRYYQISGINDTFYVDELQEAVNRDEINGTSLLDVGTGPCIHTAIVSSKKFSNIILSDYSGSNREELIKWIKNDPNSHDWKNYFDYVSKKESLSAEEITKRTRESVKACMKIDVNLSNPLEPNWLNPFDCILTSLCLETACSDFESYKKAIGNLSNLLKPNGTMIMMGVLGETFYKVEDTKWNTLTLEEKDIKEALIINGHEIIFFNSHKFTDKEIITSDSTGLFIVLSKKRM